LQVGPNADTNAVVPSLIARGIVRETGIQQFGLMPAGEEALDPWIASTHSMVVQPESTIPGSVTAPDWDEKAPPGTFHAAAGDQTICGLGLDGLSEFRNDRWWGVPARDACEDCSDILN
jgi:hypothetical protein